VAVGAATLATACGEAVDEGFGTVVLGLEEASAELFEPLPQPQLLVFIQDGVAQPLVAPPDLQPVLLTTRPKPKAQAINHRESATRMIGDPSLVPVRIIRREIPIC
jgi:hypothetical protein